MIFSRHDAGFGNLLILLSDSFPICKKIYKNVYDAFELSTCVEFVGYEITDEPGEHPPAILAINQYSINNVHPRIRDFVQPTNYMKDLIVAHTHLLEGVTTGVHIRRGHYSNDSRQFKTTLNGTFLHCSDSGLDKFKNIIRQNVGKVYVASDSKELKDELKKEFGDKLSMLDTEFAITAHQDAVNTQTVKNLHDAYLEWFLLSMCSKLYSTGGNEDFTGFSTYSYTAGIYGKNLANIIFN